MQGRHYAKFMQIDCLPKISWNGRTKSLAKYIATKSRPKLHQIYPMKRIGNQLKFCHVWWHFGQICSSCKIHLNFPFGVMAMIMQLLWHVPTLICVRISAKNIFLWNANFLWATYFVSVNQESYNSEQLMKNKTMNMKASEHDPLSTPTLPKNKVEIWHFAHFTPFQMFARRNAHILHARPL